MTDRIAPRIRWAIETMDIQPGDRVLEIGGGHGVAATLVAERLTTGHFLGIDRSAKMTEAAHRRNRVHVEAGRAAFEQASLESWQPNGRTFDTAFAINVRLFADLDHRGVATVRSCLKVGGRFYCFFQPPTADGIDALVAQFRRSLETNGFTTVRTEITRIEAVPIACVIARKPCSPRTGATHAG